MASICTRKSSGARSIQFYGVDGERKTLLLGKLAMRQAQQIKLHVERILDDQGTGCGLPSDTLRWLASVEDRFHARLVSVGLAEHRQRATLGECMERYIEFRRPTVKARTIVRMEQAKHSLLEHYPAEKRLRDFTAGDAEDFRAWMVNEKGLAEATARKRCADVSAMMRYAIRHRMIESNPFQDVATGTVGNDERQAFISEADAIKVMVELPSPQWRLLFALARWGGLRVPSEPATLTWGDVAWDAHRLTVHSPKTQQHAGKATRVLPLFPEIEGPMREAFEQAAEGEQYMLPMLQDRTPTALRKPLFAAIKRAGLKPWPRLWHNLRASRQTDLVDRFPAHVVCEWIGNSEAVARNHYLQVTDEHYRLALPSDEGDGDALRNRQQQGSATPAIERNETPFIRDVMQENAGGYDQVTGVGLEPDSAKADDSTSYASGEGVALQSAQRYLSEGVTKQLPPDEAAILASVVRCITEATPAKRARLLRSMGKLLDAGQ